MTRHRQLGRCAVVVTFALTFNGTGGAAQSESHFEGNVLRRVVVPDAGRPHGEVRIVRRDGTVVVETVLVTKVLRRALREIAKRESANWKESSEGYTDAHRYVAALERAGDRLWQRYGEVNERGDRRQRLLIEFRSSPAGGQVTLMEPQTDGELGSLHVTDATVIERVSVSPTYAEEDMKLIVADSFRISEPQAEALLVGAGLAIGRKEQAPGASP